MKKILFLLIVYSFFVGCSSAQSPQFTQFNTQSLYLNPAYTGATRHLRLAYTHRLQWLDIKQNVTNLNGRFDTYSLSIDYFNKKGQGYGGYILVDNTGNLGWQNTKVGLSIAQEIAINRHWRLRAGGALRLNQYFMKNPEYVFEDALRRQATTSEPLENLGTAIAYLDLCTGISISHKWGWASLAINYTPDYQKTLIGIRTPTNLKNLQYALDMGTKIHIGADISMKLWGIFRKEVYLQRFDIGASCQIKQFTAGIHYRGVPILQKASLYHVYNNSVAPFAGLKIAKKGQMYINYSFDFAISGLSQAGNIHEVSFVWEVSPPEKRRKHAPYSPKKKRKKNFAATYQNHYDWGNKKDRTNRNSTRYANSIMTLY